MRVLVKINLTVAAIILILGGTGCNRGGDDKSQPTICFAFQA